MSTTSPIVRDLETLQQAVRRCLHMMQHPSQVRELIVLQEALDGLEELGQRHILMAWLTDHEQSSESSKKN